jgi:hypothetical protein
MTTTELFSGRITSFRREQAFGLITLDDGTPVKFDAGICTMVPEEGAAVRARVGPAKWGGGLKALYVEAAETAMAALAGEARPRPLEELLAAVQREHLVSGLTEQILGELIAQRFGGRLEAGTILGLLDAYYTEEPGRARSDGYLRRATAGVPPASDDVLAELAELLPDAKLPRQVEWSGRPAAIVPRDESQIETARYERADTDAPGGASAAPAAPALVVSDADGRERSVEVGSLDDVIELANAALRRAGDGRRVYKLQTGGDWQAYLAIASDRALRLASTLPFAPPPADVA